MRLTLGHYQKISLLSGFLINFVFGSLYTLGTVTPYIASYIHYNDNPNIYAIDVSILYPTYMVSQVAGIVLSMYLYFQFRIILQKYIGFKILCFIGVYGMALCAFVTSFFSSYAAIVFFYGVLFGFLVGFCYFIPMLNCYAYLPKKKGLCSGVCMMAFGLGSLVFNFILLELINPENQKTDEQHLFPIEVAQNVPKALRYISLVYFSIGTVGCLLMIPKSTLKLEQTLQEEKENYQSTITDDENKIDSSEAKCNKEKQPILSQDSSQFKTPFKELLKTKEYKQLFVMILTSITFGAFVAFNYKEYGETLTKDDRLITLIGSLGAVFNSIGRIFWCSLLDKYSFKTITLILNTTQIICAILMILVKNPYFYIFLVVLVYFSYGPNFGLYPTQTVRVYGDKDGSRIYPLTFSAFSLASVVQFLFHYFIVKRMGDSGFLLCFLIFGVMLLVAEVMLYKINFTYPDQIDKKTLNNSEKPEKA